MQVFVRFGAQAVLKLSIVICTKDRSALLRRLLSSLEVDIGAQSDDLEILVVASGCEDDTASVAASFLERLPLRIVVEPLPGLSKARNTALTNTKSEAILWLDDDTEVFPGLISAYIRALDQYPEATYYAGRILPRIEGTPPSWVQYVIQNQPSTYSLLDLGNDERLLDASLNEFPFGANMLVRRSVVEGFRFREDLGRNHDPGNLVGGEETELFQMLSAGGHHGVWIPGAAVLHLIPKSRQTFRYYATYQYAVGIIGVRLLNQKTTPFAWALYPQFLFLILSGRLLFKPETWVRVVTKLQRERGRVAEAKTNKKTGSV